MFQLTFNSYFDDLMQMNSAHLSYQGPTWMLHYYLVLRNLLSKNFYACVRRHSYYKSSEMCRYSLYFNQLYLLRLLSCRSFGQLISQKGQFIMLYAIYFTG